MVLGRYLCAALGLDINFSNNDNISGAGPYSSCLLPMGDVNNYNVNPITYKNIKAEELFINYYVSEYSK